MGISADSSKQLLHELLRITKYNLVACGYEKLTVSNTAVALTVPAGANYALITVESTIATPAIRYLELGNSTLPTSSVGLPRTALDTFDVHGYSNLINFRAIQTGAGTHSLSIQYYK